MSQSVSELQQDFRQLRLAETADALPQILREAEMASWTYIEFLSAITNHERAKRDAKSLERRMKWARFPFIKSLSEFNLEEQTALTARQLKQLKQLNWLEQQYNLILLGPPGVGKTFLAVGLGIEAVNHGFKVYFVTMGELVQLLKSEEFSSKSKIQLKFHLVNHLYERSSIILTSNKSPEQWGELIGDQGITTAILDRLLHRVEIICQQRFYR